MNIRLCAYMISFLSYSSTTHVKWGSFCRTGHVCVCANTFALFVTCIKSVHWPPIAGKEKLCLVQKCIFLSDECELKGEEQIC